MAFFVRKSRYLELQNELRRIADERDDALRRGEEDQTRLAAAPRHLLFFHIPRTGGSSLWHALAGAGAASGIPLIDLYHLAREQFGSTEALYSVLAEQLKLLRRTSALIHLHTAHNLDYFFDEPDLMLTTVVRDPIDRFISDICHLRETLPHATDSDRENFIRRAGWQPDFARAMFTGGQAVEALAELGASEPFFRDYYYHQFYGMLCGRPAPAVEYMSPKSTDDIKELAALVRARFTYIGRYPHVAEIFHDIADLFALPHERGSAFSFAINKRDSQNFLPDRRARFGEAFGRSYELLARIGMEF